MRSEYAHSIVSWRYDGDYAVYNLDPDSVSVLCDPSNDYYAATDSADTLLGFCCFGVEARVEGLEEEAGALDIGIGLRPDLTGLGIGAAFLARTLELAFGKHRPPSFRVAIAEFNVRAQRVAEAAGFRPERCVMSRGRVFVVMRRPGAVRTRS
jgi:RimJ/RimL family protein N-acetyltransferase